MSESEFTGLEIERIAYIEDRLFELDEIICHNNAELEAANSEVLELLEELGELKEKIKKEQEN